jgi:hypothetical protein
VPGNSWYGNSLHGRRSTSHWHIGTHHEFSVDYDDPLISKYLSEDGSEALYADFTICPIEKYVRGAAQAVIVKSIKNPRVVTRKDWSE